MSRVRRVKAAPPDGAWPDVVDDSFVGAVRRRVHGAEALGVRRVVERRLEERRDRSLWIWIAILQCKERALPLDAAEASCMISIIGNRATVVGCWATDKDFWLDSRCDKHTRGLTVPVEDCEVVRHIYRHPAQH